MENGLDGKSALAEESSGGSDTSREAKCRAPNTPEHQPTDAPERDVRRWLIIMV